MRKKQFKAESKKLLDMMINSIYTHKEIFIRELISNASDALDKLYYRSLSDNSVGFSRNDYQIHIDVDKDNRLLIISDNGCGMTADELENNLGTIAKSGSFNFKKENEKTDDVDIIGQFGVGFYSAFMVSDEVKVESKAFGEDKAYRWISNGADGYSVEECDIDKVGTVVTLHIKPDTEEEKYSEFLDSYRISSLVKKYSDYIRYPIVMDMETRRLKEGAENEYETVREQRTLNSMVPLWKKTKSELKDDDYNNFYKEKFMDYTDPTRVIHSKTEGQVTYDALLFIPSHPPFDYYTKEFEKGLQLYSNGVLIMDKCAELLPDYFSFVKGLVDSPDLSLNISRELLQHDYQLKLIAKNIEKKVISELSKMQKNEREKYEEFYKHFGVQLKYGIYANFGANKDTLKDLLLFYSSKDKAYVTLKEYTERMAAEQKSIYYASGETLDKIDMLPQVESVKVKGYEVLYLTDNVDEFALQMLHEYNEKSFANVLSDKLDIDTDEEKDKLKQQNEDAKSLFETMKESIGESVHSVRFTSKLNNHPVCLATGGEISIEMEKVLNSMPTDQKVKAEVILEINVNHPIAQKLKELYVSDKEKLAVYSKILYSQARLISGMSVDNPTELSNMICELMV